MMGIWIVTFNMYISHSSDWNISIIAGSNYVATEYLFCQDNSSSLLSKM